MAAVTPNPDKIRAFASAAAFERWLRAHHEKELELWLEIHKKGSGLPTVSYAEALDVALCWGWIDGLKKPFDDSSFLQRFTPRKAKSRWSQINCKHVARLIDAGRMQPAGMRHVDLAKADGRWDAAYASPSQSEVPKELLRAIDAVPKARATFDALNRVNRYALAYRLTQLKTEAARVRKIADFVAMLARGETIHPNTAPSAKTSTKRAKKKAPGPARQKKRAQRAG